MRIASLAVLAACLHLPAHAADFGPLRGTHHAPPGLSPVANWEGGYIGGFAGYSMGNFEGSTALQDPYRFIFRNLVVEQDAQLSNRLAPRSDDASEKAFGAFAGYNFQYDEAVLGFELDYTRARLKSVSGDQYLRRVGASNGLTYNVNLNGNAKAEIDDIATIRARAGITMGSFLPYVTGGIAFGRASITRTIAADLVEIDPMTGVTTGRLVENRKFGPKESLLVGYTAGLGIDMAITQNLMLRAEYQYVYFDDLNGYKMGINNLRAGAGVKF